MFLSAAAPRLVIDPFDSSLTNVDGAVTFRDPGSATNSAGDNWREAATARFVPRDPDDLDAYDEVYRWCFTHFRPSGRFVWTDECAEVLPVSRYPKQGRLLLAQGAKRMLGHIGATQRPREILRGLIANAQHVFVWPMPNPDDVKHLADVMGIPLGVLTAELAQLAEHAFVWCDLVNRTVTSCPALSL